MIGPLVTLLALVALAAQPAQPVRADDAAALRIESAIAGLVSPEAGHGTVRALVRCGVRGGGSPSGACAAAHIESEFRSLGLSVERREDPPLEFYEASDWSVRVDGAPVVSAWPVDGSPGVGRLEIALAADGRDREAWKGAAVLTRREARAILAEAAAAGAGAILSWYPADPNQFVTWAPAGRGSHAGGGSLPIPAFRLSYEEGQALERRLESAEDGGKRRAEIRLSATSGRGAPVSVVGTLPGSGALAEQIVMVCAHGDSDGGGPGADDNASGVASLLEVARALTTATAKGWLRADRPRLLFAVWGTEIHSSKAWLAANSEAAGRLRAVINYDQTGFGAERDAVYFEGNDVPWSEPLLRALESVSRDHAGEPGFATSYTSNPTMGGTDMYVFLPRAYKGLGLTEVRIPATTVFVSAWDRPGRMPQTPGWQSPGWPDGGELYIDYSTYYHSAGDTPANTTEREPENLVRCARLVAAGIARYLEVMASRGGGEDPAIPDGHRGMAPPGRR